MHASTSGSSAPPPPPSLSTYDLKRTVRKARLKSDSAEPVLLEKFADELSCPICKKFLRDPVVTKACLHRFCGKCIRKRLDEDLRGCPKCGKKLSKKAPVKTDSNFASLITKLNARRKEAPRRSFIDAIEADGIEICRRQSRSPSFDDYAAHFAPASLANGSGHGPHTSTPKRPAKDQYAQGDDDAPTLSNGFHEERGPSRPKQNGEAGASGGKSTAREPSPKRSRSSSSPPPELMIDEHWGSLEPEAESPEFDGPSGAALNGSMSSCTLDLSLPSTSKLDVTDPEDLPNDSDPTKSTSFMRRKPVDNESRPPLHNFLTEGGASLRKRRVFAKSSYTSLVLWPDGSVFKEDVPNCVKHARYIYTSHGAQVAHLAEYLVLRARMEAGWADYNKYTVEITNVEEERDEFALYFSKSKCDAEQMRFEGVKDDNDTILLQFKKTLPDQDYVNMMVATAHPFRPLPSHLTVADLLARYYANRRRPLKVVYRFVRREVDAVVDPSDGFQKR